MITNLASGLTTRFRTRMLLRSAGAVDLSIKTLEFGARGAIFQEDYWTASVILNVWFSPKPLLTTCFCPDGQSTSMRSIFVASPRPK